MFLITLLLVIISLISLTSYIINRTGYRGKFKKHINALKKRLFFNMLIAFTLMNALKFYVLALTIVNGADVGIVKKILAGLCLLLMVILPLFYARLLYKWQNQLHKAELRDKFGKLYEGLHTTPKVDSASKRPLIWLYSPLFLVRRGLFAAITAFVLDIEHTNLKIIMHLVMSLVYVTVLLANGYLYAGRKEKVTEIFCEFMNIFGLILLQQFQYTDNKTAVAVIEAMFLACLILIALSNISFLGISLK